MAAESAPDQRAEAHEVFLRYFARDVERLRGYVFTLLPNAQDAEDIFQQTSMVLWQKFDQFDRDRSFFHWACGIAFHLVLNFRRVKARERLVFNEELLANVARSFARQSEYEAARRTALDGCIEKLSDKERELVDQRYGQDGTVKHLAERLGRPAKSLYKQLERIRAKLMDCVHRTLLKQDWQGHVDAG